MSRFATKKIKWLKGEGRKRRDSKGKNTNNNRQVITARNKLLVTVLAVHVFEFDKPVLMNFIIRCSITHTYEESPYC